MKKSVVEQLRQAIRANPFLQFNITTSDGRVIEIRVGGSVSMSPDGSMISIYKKDQLLIMKTSEITGICPVEDFETNAIAKAQWC